MRVQSAEGDPGPSAAPYDVVTVQHTGDDSNRIGMVFVGDGYQASEFGTYAVHVQGQVDHLFNGGLLTDPFARYHNFFNIYRINVASNQSGADDPVNGIVVDTALDSSFAWQGGPDRLLSFDSGKANAVINTALAGTGIVAEMKFGAVNTTKYGGAGGEWAVYAGGNSFAYEVATHEVGHSFAHLGDQYTYGGPTTYTGEEPFNPDVTKDPTGAKWAQWIGYDQPGVGVIGVYEGAKYSEFGVYRPSPDSKMRSLDKPFDAIGREQFILNFYKYVRPIDSHTDSALPLVDPATLAVAVVDPAVILLRWSYDGTVVEDSADGSFDPTAWNRASGDHQITALAYDPTDWVRQADRSALQEQVIWNVTLKHAILRANATLHSLVGGRYVDRMYGTAAADTLDGADGKDVLSGGAGRDTLIGGASADKLVGGADEDRAQYAESTKGLVVSLANPTLNTGIAKGDTYDGIEDVYGSDFSDTLSGDGANNTLWGADGNDVLAGGIGADALVGGSGIDRADYADSTKALTVNLAQPAANTGIAKGDTYKSIEDIGGSDFGDTLTGSSGDNAIWGGKGDDTLSGGDGNDVLLGGDGADALKGGDGRDTLAGGRGRDTLVGGADRDRFVFDAALNGSTNVDRVTDFKAGEDVVCLDNAIFTALPTVGVLASTAFVMAAAAQDAGDRVIYNPATGALLYDPDGLGGAAATKLATLSTGLALSSGDFRVV